MIILGNGLQIDETEIIDYNFLKGTIVRVSDIIEYVLKNPDEFRPEAKKDKKEVTK